MSEQPPPEFKSELVKDVEFLKNFADRLLRDLNEDTVAQGFVISTLYETVGKIAYNAGRYNQLIIAATEQIRKELKSR